MPFTLDTSGSVRNLAILPFASIIWEDLTPFTQGYVRAALTEWNDVNPSWLDERNRLGFSFLAPEALAVMIADCERFRLSFANGLTEYGETQLQEIGAGFWRDRQGGAFPARDPHFPFPPLTLTLRDDGKIVTGVAQ